MPIAKVRNRITSQQIEINYDMKGDGIPFVFLHPMGRDVTYWDPQVSKFAEKFKVVRCDIRGHGQTESPPGGYSMPIFSEDLFRFLRSQRFESAYICGLSLGGMVALRFALDHPEMVEALILCDTSSEGQTQSTKAHIDAMENIAQEKGMEGIIEYRLENGLVPENIRNDPEQLRLYRERMLASSPAGYLGCLRALDERPSVTDQLSKIKAPTLIIVGEHDINFLEPASILHRGIEGSKLVVIPQAGHTSSFDQPDIFNTTILNFIEEFEEKRASMVDLAGFTPEH
ncbi:MAG: alpha/beta fold hydrolase [Candidatus Tectomicrobia bacterium]|nr:alpha/beta fold hydrolase [Candidatus Tectomicrobia bacterium]